MRHKTKKVMKKKTIKKEVILLILTLVVMFIFMEIGFRVYFSVIGEEVGISDNEKCMKEIKKQLPNGDSFKDFHYLGPYKSHPKMGITLKPNFIMDIIKPIKIEKEEMNLVVYNAHHNAQGMRNIKEFTKEKPEKVTIRVAMYGDSYTYGDDVPLKLGMSNILQEILPESEVLNFGVPGKGTDTMYLRYLFEGKEFSTDVIVFNVYVEDIQRHFTTCVVDRPNIIIKSGQIEVGKREYESLIDFYETYNPPRFESYFLKHGIYLIGNINKNKRNMRRGFQQFDAILNSMKKEAEKENVVFIVGLIGGDKQTNLTKKYYQKLKELLKTKEIPTFDSDEYFENNKEAYKGQSFHYVNKEIPSGHFSPIGYALYAQGLKNELLKAGLTEDSTEYYFANFKHTEPLIVINKQLQEPFKTIHVHEVREKSYKNQPLP